MIQESLRAMIAEARRLIEASKDLATLEELRVRFLGKKGELTALFKQLHQLPLLERPAYGKMLNVAKQKLKTLLSDCESALQSQVMNQELASQRIDITLPGRKKTVGALHPVRRVCERVVKLFASMGFEVVEGSEVEDEYYNFEALNMPSHHPARATVDTFYFNNGTLLRTHTSPVQIHLMERKKPPLRMITPGRVYRRDADATHTPMFHQLEGLVVDRSCHFSNLKGLLQLFFDRFFESAVNLRFRPSFFPFTEPSAEVDIRHSPCKGQGCHGCSGSGWLEVLGCGMVHADVLSRVDVDPMQYTGFAFGLGLDRLAMLRYGIDDLRLLFENDLRVLGQFR